MTTRDDLHQLIDQLSPELLDEARAYLEAASEVLSDDATTAADEAFRDIDKGNFISLDEYCRTRGL